MEERFLKFMQDKNLSENTYNSYANDIRLYKKYFFDSYGKELDILVHADISSYCNYLFKNNISALTINRKIAALKQYNLFLIEEHIQDKVVIVDRDYIKIHNSSVKSVVSQKEIEKLKHFTSRDEKNPIREYCFITILAYAGLRASEIVRLRIIDINLENRFLYILGKGNKLRQVIINNLIYDALKEYLEERNIIETENPYLFIGQKNKNTTKPLSRNYCNRLLNKYKTLCDNAKLHPHGLRAYFCTNALHNAGYTVDQVADQAGNSSLNTTKKYLDPERKSLLELSNKM